MQRFLFIPVLVLFFAMLFAGLCDAATDYPPAVAAKQMSESDVQFLTQGVDGIGQSGAPGPLTVYGRNAAAVLAGKEGDTNAVLVAAAKYQSGRVIAFGHEGYLNPANLLQFSGEVFAKNILRWLTKNQKDACITVVNNQPLVDLFVKFGYSVLPIKGLADFKPTGDSPVLVMDAGRITEPQVTVLEQFIAKGGGLLTGSLGWGWLQVSGKHNLQTEHNGNVLLAPMGIVWADGYLSAPEQKNGKNFFPAALPETLRYLNVSTALQEIFDADKKNKTLDKNVTEQAIATVVSGIQSIPSSQSSMLAPLRPLLQKTIIPSPENKIKKETMPMEALAVSLQTTQYLKKQDGTGKQKIPSLAAAESFPGAVPKNAPSVKKDFLIDTSIPDWHSLGLYAPPGQTITVTIPNDIAAAKNRRYLAVRIGCHRDSIWHLKEWTRFPEITIELPLRAAETKIVNPFGGLVYITVPHNYGKGTVSVNVAGCVESPLYIHGKTSVEEWKKTLRNVPAPWGELASEKVILSVPSQYLRTLDDPDKVMEFWNKVFDCDADLCGRSSASSRPERITCDRQISAGYMHSGYPVMTHLDLEQYFLSLKDTPDKAWGFFHEFGHNHQSGDWTFDGTTEVTVNLFTLYCSEKLFQRNTEQARGHGFSPDERKKMREKHFAAGSPFDKWKSDPFLALIMYIDIQEEFGWEPFKNVFREYLALPNEERPKNDDEKRSQWMVRLSQEVKRNLGNYFDRWGVPVSPQAKDSIKNLPEWNPY